MYIQYHTDNGEVFNSLEKAFDHEWNTMFPNVRIFDFDGDAVSSLFYNDRINFIYRVHNYGELIFITNYMRLKYDEVEFHEYWQNENKDSGDGYIIETESEIAFVTKDSLKAFFADTLNPCSDLAYALEGD